jgi:uncharacterized membrane protein YbhN (UPF0104 family)
MRFSTVKEKSEMKRWVVRVAGFLFTALSIAYFVSVAVHNIGALPPIRLSGRVLTGMGAGLLLYLLTAAMMGLCWFVWLQSVGESLGLKLVMIIFALANIAKYLPGNVGHIVGRAALAKRQNLRMPNVILSIGLEAIWVALSGSALALVFLVIDGYGHAAQTGYLNIQDLVAAICILIAMPVVSVWGFNRWRPPLLKRLLGPDIMEMPGFDVLSGCFAIYLLVFLLMGASATIIATLIFDSASSPYWPITGFLAVAWIAGFLAPASPAGVGVREAVLVASLSSILGPGVAIGLSVALRIITTVGDGLVFLMALPFRRLALNRRNALE